MNHHELYTKLPNRSLSNDEANAIHDQVIADLKNKFGVEIR